MALLDVADILARVLQNLNRPASDEVLTSTILYSFMTEAQSEAVELLAAHVPTALMGAPVALTTADSGATYTFGTDSGLPSGFTNKFPIGHAEIYQTRSSIPDSPLIEGEDYLLEGETIRMPYNLTRQFADGGPWARFIAPPGVIDAATQPTLTPPFARVLIVDGTCIRACVRLDRDAGPFERQWNKDWKRILLALKTQVWTQGSGRAKSTSQFWWRSPDFG